MKVFNFYTLKEKGQLGFDYELMSHTIMYKGVKIFGVHRDQIKVRDGDGSATLFIQFFNEQDKLVAEFPLFYREFLQMDEKGYIQIV